MGTTFFYINISLVFLFGASYSFIELLSFFNTTRSFFKTMWGWVYIILNGLLSILALVLTFKNEVSEAFLGLKLIIAGTSALALIRVIIIPIKNGENGNNLMPIIDIILNHVRIAYDRERSKFTLNDVKKIMTGIDYKKAAEALPVLCSNLLQTISEEDGKKMNEEIQKLLTLDEGGKEIKAINLGIILARYIGIDLLRKTVEGTNEFISITNSAEITSNEMNTTNLDSLIDKFS